MKLPRLREWREKRGLTQQELADRIGSARDTISKWETEDRGAQPMNAQRLADVLKVEVKDLTSRPWREWALLASEEEFANWVESANLHEVLTLNGELSAAAQEEDFNTERHRYILSRINKVIERFTRVAGPFTLAKRWDEPAPDTQEARERAG